MTKGEKDSLPKVTIDCRSLTATDTAELTAFLESSNAVAAVHSRIPALDAAFDPAEHPRVAVVVGLVVVFGRPVASKALDILGDLIRDWLKKRGNNEVEPGVLYDCDGKPVIKFKRKRKVR